MFFLKKKLMDLIKFYAHIYSKIKPIYYSTFNSKYLFRLRWNRSKPPPTGRPRSQGCQSIIQSWQKFPLSHTLMKTHTRTHSHTLSFSLSHSHIQINMSMYSFLHSISHTHSFFLLHAHTHTHSPSLSLTNFIKTSFFSS